MRNPIPRVAAIHDLAGFARTSLTAAIPILSSMGIQATPLPTAILSTQTVGYNDFTLLDLTDDMVRILVITGSASGCALTACTPASWRPRRRWIRRRGASGIASLPAAWLWSIPCSGMTAS